MLISYLSSFCSYTNVKYLSSLGEKGTGKSTQKPLHYKSCLFHRVVKDFMIQGGDFSEGRRPVFKSTTVVNSDIFYGSCSVLFIWLKYSLVAVYIFF